MKKLYSVREASALDANSEEGLAARIATAEAAFTSHFDSQPTLCVRSPGRAEIIGNHTDYNNGYALAAAISRSIIAVFGARADGCICIASTAFSGEPITFSLSDLKKDNKNSWVNYCKAVIHELQQDDVALLGANILLDSNLPFSGGVSSSAALELAIAAGLLGIADKQATGLEMALLCKRAENGEFVGTPCGLLDQASVALGKSNSLLFIDFLATAKDPITTKVIQAQAALEGHSFVLAVDPFVKRNLGETGYPARRRKCEESLPILSALLGKNVSALRDVSVAEFKAVKQSLLERSDPVLVKRVEHIVFENQRVLDAVTNIEAGNIKEFGTLLNESGVSALTLYELDEKTPELTRLVALQRDNSKTLGIRNMGGGFSAITLALLRSEDVKSYTDEVSNEYQKEFGRALNFIDFVATDGVSIL